MIRPPTINLARRPFRNNTVYYAVFGTCVAVLLMASVYNVYDYVRTGKDLARLETDLADRTQVYMALRDDVESMKKDIQGLNLKTLDSKSSFANGLILSRLFSWSTLFDRMEELIPPDVKIRSIRPSISQTGIEIQIDGLARTAEEMYEFEKNLGDSDFFYEVYPVSENTRESKTEINFDLVMNYIPAGKTGSGVESPAQPAAGALQETTTGPVGDGAEQEPTAEAAFEAPAPQAVLADQAAAPSPPAAVPEAQAQIPSGQGAPAPLQAPQQNTPAPKPQVPEARVLPPGPAATPVESSDQVDSDAAARPDKPMGQYTNKEVIDTHGETKFLAMRGALIPINKGPDSNLNNREYIQKYGLEKFIVDRGALNRRSQKPGGVR